jgi:uncharacterized protein
MNHPPPAAMQTLIVDGHSVIFAWPELRKLNARRTLLAREALVKMLTEYQDAAHVRAVVVFDGKGAAANEQSEPGGIQIFYSSATQTADEVIERIVAKYANTRRITVATDDHMEQQTVNSFGAEAISTDGLKTLLDETRTNFSKTMKKHRRKD